MADYELIKRLGKGAFGEVWLVDDRALGVQRAVKYIPPHKISHPSEFYKEPQVLLELKHENIIEVTDAGTTLEGQLYIAMPYCQNGSISDITKGSIVPTRKAIQLLSDVCRALEYAHSKNYIHRDIKPANILIDDNLRAKLSDFGLATQLDIEGIAPGYGYIGHLAPEVLNYDYSDKRSDIYALAVTAYRMVKGDALLPMNIDPNELIELIKLGKFPDKNKYREQVPLKLRTAINKGLAVLPGNRYQSPAAFRRALESIHLYGEWLPQTILNGTRWTTTVAGMEYEVISVTNGKKLYDIELFKGKTGIKKRIVNASCAYGLNNRIREKHLKNILNRISTKGK